MKKSYQDSESRSSGFALVITLIIVVLAAIIAVALLSNASADRSVAATLGDTYESELAAQNGLEAAKNALQANVVINSVPTSRSQNDDFIVVSANDSNNVPYYFVGSCNDGNNTGTSNYTQPYMQYFPLFSGGATQPGLIVTAGAAPPPATTIGPGTQAQQTFGNITVNYPKLFATAPYSTWQTKIHTNWQTTPIPGTTKEYRYTYWIEDLAGYVDAKVAGNTDGSGTTNIRSLGYDPKEEGLFTLFSPASEADPGNTYASQFLVPNHPLLFTRLSTRLGQPSTSDDTTCQTSLAANLQSDLEQAIIPHGMGYKNEGKLKTNLNQIIADIAANKRTPDAAIDGPTPPPAPTPAASPIVPTITDNLPNFATKRQGGLGSSAEGYLETIAANIIDYADSDLTPTVNTNSVTGKHYRGIDLMPFVTEVYEMYYWKTDYYQKEPPTGNYFVDIEVKTFVQLWNMFAQDITSGTLSFTDTLTAGLKFGSANTTSSFDQGTKTSPNVLSITFSPGAPLKSNESRAVLVSDITYTLDAGTAVKPTGTIDISDHSQPSSSATDQDSSYTVLWNGVAYDQPGFKAGTHLAMERNATSLTKVGAISKLVGTMPALRYTKTSGNAPYVLGDPRMSYYINGTQYSSSYNGGSAWGGAVYMKTLVEGSGWAAGEARVGGWPDGGHSSIRGVTPTTDPTSLSQDPTTVNPNPIIEATKAPARISNRADGRINSITELSYVYDPFQWNPFPATFTKNPAPADVDSVWHNTWKNAFTVADYTYGSHSTLRIGRPEHNTFDQDGTRAWQLLDIFSVGDPSDLSPAGATTNQLNTRGKININTASAEALRALGAGIQIGNLNTGDVDQAIQPSAVYGPRSSKAADLFAQYVIAQRAKQPFLSTSQLAGLSGSNTEPFFGNPDQWANGDGPTIEQLDTISKTTSPTVTKGTTDWNDAASEQYFAKIYNFTTVRSRNFRVFVTGQYYDTTSNQVISTANKVYEVFLKPTRDPNSTPSGNITGQTCVVTYAADLPQ